MDLTQLCLKKRIVARFSMLKFLLLIRESSVECRYETNRLLFGKH